METNQNSIHYFSELHFISKGLIEVSFNFTKAKDSSAQVEELIFLSFTPTSDRNHHKGGVYVDNLKRETMVMNLENVRSFAEALKLGGVSLTEPSRDIFLRDKHTGKPMMPEKYRTFNDIPLTKTNQLSKRSSVSITPIYDADTPYLNVVFSSEKHESISISFDPQQARGFGEEVMNQTNDFKKELGIYKRNHS